jgi:hypothetical protein
VGSKNPYEAHLCAVAPEDFECGFHDAAEWVRRHPRESVLVHEAIRDSSGVSWNRTARRLDVPPTAYHEGRALGVYGLVEVENTRSYPRAGKTP